MQKSCFSKYSGEDGVCIALRHPEYFEGKCYPDLFPKKSFLFKYFEDHDEEAYAKAYHEQVLSKLDPLKVWNDLKDSTILCWEGSGKFCHRHLVAAWLEKSLRVKIKESR